MGLIDAERVAAIKSRVKAECLRRRYTGSVAAYGGPEYDYDVEPEAGEVITKEHYEKNAVPLHAINSNDFPDTDGGRVIDEEELLRMEEKLSAYESRSRYDTARSDCSVSCTGLCLGCTGSCSNVCTGCYNSCWSTCEDDCRGTCSNLCRDDCSISCTAECRNSCSGDCTGWCEGACTGECSGTCEGECADACTGVCKDGCTAYCGGSCTGGCGYNCVGYCYTGCYNTAKR